jgi:hypothetical protein
MKQLEYSRRLFLLPALLLPAGLVGSVSVNGQKPTRAAINLYAKQVDLFSKRHHKRSFANVGSDTDNWREFKTAAALNRAAAAPFPESALVWLKAGQVIAANFTFTSESGDWAQYVTYYFRQNGKLAKIQARLNTFNGNLSVVREKFYDDNGKLLDESTTFLDLASRKPAPARDFADEPIPTYLNARDLPFNKLL